MKAGRTHRVIRRTLLGLWLLGAVLIVLGGMAPGYEAYRSGASELSYPMRGVAAVLVFSALELGGTWLILRPSSYLRSYLRSGLASLVLTPWLPSQRCSPCMPPASSSRTLCRRWHLRASSPSC